jgi:hypothetical protein
MFTFPIFPVYFVDHDKGTVLHIDSAVIDKYHGDTILDGDRFERWQN